MRTFTLLSLGDSYTIGESVEAKDNFPNKTVKLLREKGFEFEDASIIAKTGWTTDELNDAINKAAENDGLRQQYDFVTLLIGVNNQYRGRSVEAYRKEFEALLNRALSFAGNKKERVIVLSIPDWGVTPFAADRDRQKIAKEINDYNAANREITEKAGITYINITPWTKEAISDPSLIAADGLHPSAKEYQRWAEKILSVISSVLN